MSKQNKPSIVFAHGLWADGSCFSKLIPTLQAEGHEVMAVPVRPRFARDRRRRRQGLPGAGQQPGDPRRALLWRHAHHARRHRYARGRARLYRGPRPGCRRDFAEPAGQFPATDVFQHIEVADGRIWLKPSGVDCFAGDLPEEEQKLVWATQGAPVRGPVQPKGRRHGLEVEAELVHRRKPGPHRPPRAGTLRREAHGRHHLRGRQQPRPHALQPSSCAGRDPQGRKRSPKISGSGIAHVRENFMTTTTIRLKRDRRNAVSLFRLLETRAWLKPIQRRRCGSSRKRLRTGGSCSTIRLSILWTPPSSKALQNLLARMDASPSLRVVVFESANPDFYLAHFDLTGKTGNITTAVGPSGLPILMDTFVRLTKSPVVSIAKIRGCVRGVSSEFVLACDMRFASRENTRLGQPEVGVGVHPGGGGTERLPHLVGRGRALEIVLGANDFDGDTAERYGYVNRALPDAELDGFVDALARRIASFDRRAIAAAKNLVNQVSLPSADRLLDALTSFETALTWPETQQRIQALLKRGLQQDADFEKRWPAVLGTLLET